MKQEDTGVSLECRQAVENITINLQNIVGKIQIDIARDFLNNHLEEHREISDFCFQVSAIVQEQVCNILKPLEIALLEAVQKEAHRFSQCCKTPQSHSQDTPHVEVRIESLIGSLYIKVL